MLLEGPRVGHDGALKVKGTVEAIVEEPLSQLALPDDVGVRDEYLDAKLAGQVLGCNHQVGGVDHGHQGRGLYHPMIRPELADPPETGPLLHLEHSCRPTS